MSLTKVGGLKEAADAFKSKRQRKRDRHKRKPQQPPQRGRSPGPAAAAARSDKHSSRAVSKVKTKTSAPARAEPCDRSSSRASSGNTWSHVQGDPSVAGSERAASPTEPPERATSPAPADRKGRGAPPPPEAVEAAAPQPATKAAAEAAHREKMASLRDEPEAELNVRLSSLSGIWDDTLDIEGTAGGPGVCIRALNKRGSLLLLDLWDDWRLEPRAAIVPSSSDGDEDDRQPSPNSGPPLSRARAHSRPGRSVKEVVDKGGEDMYPEGGGGARPASSDSPARPLLRPTLKRLSNRPPMPDNQRAIEEGLVRYIPPPNDDDQTALDEEAEYHEWLHALSEWRPHLQLNEDLLVKVLHSPQWWNKAIRGSFTFAVASMLSQQSGRVPSWPEIEEGGTCVPLSDKQVALGGQLFRCYDSLSAATRGYLRALWSDCLRNTKSKGDWPGFGDDPTKPADLELAEESPSVRGYQLREQSRRPPEPRGPPPGYGYPPAGGVPRFHQRGGARAPVGSRALSLASGSATLEARGKGSAASGSGRIPAWKGRGRAPLAIAGPAPKRMPGRGRGSAASSGDPASAGERSERKKKKTRRAGTALTAKRHRKRARLAEEERAEAEAADDDREGEDSASEPSPSAQDE